MANVLITSEYFGKFTGKAKQLLIEAGHIVIDNPYGHKLLTPEEIIPIAADAHAFICDLEQITREVIDAAPRLKIIARRGVGLDSVDCEYAQSKNIEVARTLNVVEAPVAELVMSYILQFSRKINIMNREFHNNKWSKILGSSVEGKTLGVVGMGKIGFEVARRAHAFGMHIIYYDINLNKAVENEYNAVAVEFPNLLAESDFITVHTPLTAETKHLMNTETIEKMKQSAYLINTARGDIINESELADAIARGKIAGAAIDVFDVEPKTNSPLISFDNVILTPHIATFTKEVFIKMDILAAENIIRKFELLKGGGEGIESDGFI